MPSQWYRTTRGGERTASRYDSVLAYDVEIAARIGQGVEFCAGVPCGNRAPETKGGATGVRPQRLVDLADSLHRDP